MCLLGYASPLILYCCRKALETKNTNFLLSTKFVPAHPLVRLYSFYPIVHFSLRVNAKINPCFSNLSKMKIETANVPDMICITAYIIMLMRELNKKMHRLHP